jgi:AraC-like DNA-binding protein
MRTDWLGVVGFVEYNSTHPTGGNSGTIGGMSMKMPWFQWPLRAQTEVIRSGRFPLDDRDFETVYRSPTHALHLYDYRCRMILAGREVEISPGDLTISPAGGETKYAMSSPGHHLCIHFTVAEGSGAMCRMPMHWALGPWKDFVVSRILEIASLHARSLGREGTLASATAGTGMHELLLYLALAAKEPEAKRAAPHSEAAMRKMVELIGDEIHRPLTVVELSERVGLSQNYLARLFRQRFGVTIQRFILVRRVELARQMLTTTDLPVSKIAAQVGMPDPQHFNKQFRKLVGMSPTAAREMGVVSIGGDAARENRGMENRE